MKKQDFLEAKIGEYAIIFNTNNKVLILRLPGKKGFPKISWTLPGGRLNKRDKAGHALHREVKEETKIKIHMVTPVYAVRAGRSKPQKYCVFFLCTVKGSDTVRLSSEHREYKWINPNRLPKISWYHISTKYAIQKAAWMMKKLS